MVRVAALFVCLVFAPTAFASPKPAPAKLPEATEEAMRVLAVTLIAEDDHGRDWHAISWVLVKRWKLRKRTRPTETFVRTAQLFSSVWKVDHPRSKRLRSLKWGKKTQGLRADQWDQAQKFVARWFSGQVQDPCPSALNWGGTMDTPVGPWRPVQCGDTRNIFYRHSGIKPRS